MGIDLTHGLQLALDEEARRQGTTPDLLAMRYLSERLFTADEVTVPESPKNLAEFLEGYIGVLDSREYVEGGANMSENTGEQFAAELLERREQGRL